MFQRIQTLYLTFAVAASVLLFFFPLANFFHQTVFADGNQQLFQFYITGVKSLIPEQPSPFKDAFTWPLTILNIATGLICLYSITRYKKRLLQMRLVAVSILLNLVMIGLFFLFYIGKIETALQTVPTYRMGAFIPLGGLGLMILAYYAIRRDEALVRTADRLR
jgi:hypothetical protein